MFAASPKSFSNDPTGQKNAWRQLLRDKLESMTKRSLAPHEERNRAYRGVSPIYPPTLGTARRESVKSTL